MTTAVLAIDQGSTNTKALLIDAAGTVIARASCQTATTYPRPGWVEQSPDDIWESVLEAVADALSATPDVRVAAVGISNQRESVLIWERATGRPLGPCVTWQCRRTAPRLGKLRQAPGADQVAVKTGLGLDPMFPAAKLAWLLDADEGLRRRAERGEICAGTVDSWLIFKLTSGQVHATDLGNAARTQLLDIRHAAWDIDLAGFFDVPMKVLPEVRSSDANFGVTRGAGDLPDGIPIRSVMGDSHAALFGHGIRKPGEIKATYGTGTSLMALTDEALASGHGLSSTIAWARDGRPTYALEGNISVSGQGAAFVTRLLGLKDEIALTNLAESVPTSDGVVFVPALAGLGAPYWRDDVQGSISGMSLRTKPAHVARAALEAIALQVCDVFRAVEADLGLRLQEVFADGGASANQVLMQLQADLLARPVCRNPVAELSAAGVASMAGITVGFWDEDAAKVLFQRDSQHVTPTMPEQHRKAILDGWHAAVGQILGGRETSLSTVGADPNDELEERAVVRF
ncbi:FGGY family carbohydrate kinase [Solirhodobacter olei]|uniref:FGGY family carbohydrate kinase n=1 Tax=Solirhodobacter olei TaxID=2493082 RepID=UPI000FD80F38|nr:FGGY family carbohydrate kinase [Solirhodobacter olei]